ncbi:MAG: alanine racemase [Campylobacteraceae bacterium]|jgi:alanine racemase|nr:alanine racemase [Campylobacteraceae bacterium]
MAHIRLSTNNLRSNLEILAKKAGGYERIAAVLKDNAYGHGLFIFAKQTANQGVLHAVTRDAKEALEIEAFFADIIVLSEHKENFFAHPNIIFAVNEFDALKSVPRGAKIALKIDSGMHRNGLNPKELDAAFDTIKQNGVILHSVFTHYRAADETGSCFFWQRENWHAIKSRVIELAKKHSINKPFFHSCNSAALLRCGEFDEDFARVGIAMYGYCDMSEAFGHFGLKPVLELFAKRISTRVLKNGECVGYGGKFTAKEEMISSLYDVGYSDGLMRYGGCGELSTSNGSLILGRMSMDSMSVNSEEKEISIFNDAAVWAKEFNTISYDILVKLNAKIPRFFV